MKIIRWGIIGCGDVTEKKSGPAFQKVPYSQLVAVMRRNEDKVRDYATRHGVPKWYTDADALISDPEVDAVYVATPPDTHALYAIKSMHAGKPVYVEKPMALNYQECLEMNRISKETGVPIFVAYYRRSLPYFKKVKEILEAKSIGAPLVVDLKYYSSPLNQDYSPETHLWRVKPEIAGGGYFYDMACHSLDILDFMFGPIEEVSGMFANKGGLYAAEDVVTANFRFHSGPLCTGSWSFVSHESAKTDTIEIIGTKGKIVFSTFGFTPIELKTEDGLMEFLPPNPPHIQLCMIESIVNTLLGKEKSPSDGISGARTSKVMDIILKKLIK